MPMLDEDDFEEPTDADLHACDGQCPYVAEAVNGDKAWVESYLALNLG